MTAMLALSEHHCMKVPIILHNENEESRIWSQVWSKDTKKQTITVVKAWQLNERINGVEVRPPSGESLEMCLQRAVAFFKEHIVPQLLIGKHVMVVAHANSLRSMIMFLDKLTSQEVIDVELSTGLPMLYTYRQRKFIRRGCPLG